VTPYRLSAAPRGGLIFGYSDLNERAIADGVARLARAVSSLREGRTQDQVSGSGQPGAMSTNRL